MSYSVIDTNLIIRFLVDTSKEAQAVSSFFEKAKPQSLEIPDIVLTEVTFVLLSFYNLPKEKVIDCLKAIITFKAFIVNRGIWIKTIELFSENSISIVDAYLCARIEIGTNTKLYTFDKNLHKITKASLP